MGNRLSKIYTRTGDDGTTGLADGQRVSKTCPLVELMGDIDELNSAVGAVRAVLDGEMRAHDRLLSEIQHDLFDLGGEVAIADAAVVQDARVAWLEGRMDELNEALPPLREFVLPAGNPAAAQCHLARAVARRAERSAWRVEAPREIGESGRRYLNRLSDLLFVLARVLARSDGGTEVTWDRARSDASG